MDRLALSLLAEPGDPRLPALLAVHEPGRVVEAARRPVSGLAVPDPWTLRAHDLDDRADQAVARARGAAMRWVCPGDAEWPQMLDDADHVEPLQGSAGAPLGLWVRGRGDLGRLSAHAVAVVGARDCTTYGAEMASDLAADVASAGWTVVSGGAFGIDACAHRGALAMGRGTVAVLACGADVDYPRSHAALLGRIADEDGLVVSEHAPGQAPTKSRFLSRNRVIAAMSAGTVVVEAAARSGSLNTLNWADRLGRTTMAVPGTVTSRLSVGTHAALRDGRAILVTSGQEVVEEVGGLGSAPAATPDVAVTEFDGLPEACRRALDALDWSDGRSVRELLQLTGLTRLQLRSALTVLERRALAVHEGSTWRIVRRADLG